MRCCQMQEGVEGKKRGCVPKNHLDLHLKNQETGPDKLEWETKMDRLWYGLRASSPRQKCLLQLSQELVTQLSPGYIGEGEHTCLWQAYFPSILNIIAYYIFYAMFCLFDVHYSIKLFSSLHGLSLFLPLLHLTSDFDTNISFVWHRYAPES